MSHGKAHRRQFVVAGLMSSLALLAACSSSAAPTTTPTASTSTKPAATSFALGLGSFGDVKLPALPADVLAGAKPTLGAPTKTVEAAGCKLKGPDRKSIAYEWGDLMVYGEAGPGETLKISSWTLRGGSTPAPVTLPLGTSMGMTRTALADALSNEKVMKEPLHSDSEIFTQDNTWWTLDKANAVVANVSFNAQPCE